MKLVLKLWSLRKEFAKYFTIGIMGFVADVGLLYILKEKFGLSATASVIIYQPVLIYAIFYLNKHWSFGSKGLPHYQMVRFLLLSATNYLIAVVWINILHDRMGVQYLVARTMNIALSVGWNFLLYKYWVYRT